MDQIMKDIIKEDIKINNRDRKLDSLINEKEYIEMKERDHPYNKRKRNR